MRRRQVLAGLVSLPALAGGASAAVSREGTLTAADVHVSDYPTVQAVRFLGARLRERTQGRLDVRVYHSGQLGREGDTVELARHGVLDITRVTFATVTNAFPSTRLFALPYVFGSVAHMRRAVDGAPGRTVLQNFAQRDLVGLAIYDAGARSFYNVRRPVLEPADLHGLKLRVPPSDIFIELVRALGANPTPLPFGESYSALQTHLIDGAENNWRSFHSSRHFEVATHWASSEHSYAPEALLMSRRRFDALQPSDRAELLDAAAASVPYMRGLWDRMEAESRASVVAAGVRVTDVDQRAFERAAEPVRRRHLAAAGLQQLHAQVQELA